jgi:hypothetical protein
MPKRKIFISYNHKDQDQAKGFNLLQWNKNVDLEFVGRHLLDPVKSKDEKYIWSKIREQLTGSSVTVVLLGQETCTSDWVAREIAASVEKDQPNGVLAIKLKDQDPAVPPDSPVGKALTACGAEVIDWNPHEFADAIERAYRAAGRVQQMHAVAASRGPICSR